MYKPPIQQRLPRQQMLPRWVGVLYLESKMKNSCGIYCITCLANGKKYIGQSIRIEKRLLDHQYELRRNNHNNRGLQGAWNKYGENSFVFSIVCECEKEELDRLETEFIDKYKTNRKDFGYNFTSGGNRNMRFSEETLEKMSKAHLGIPRTPESCKRQSNTLKGIKNTYPEVLPKERKVQPDTKIRLAPKSKNKSSKYLGVSKAKDRGWVAYICIKAAHYHLGTFDSEEYAAKVRDAAMIQIKGTNKNLNFPNDILKNVSFDGIKIKTTGDESMMTYRDFIRAIKTSVDVWVWTAYSKDDGCYVPTSKNYLLKKFSSRENYGNILFQATVQNNGSLFIN